jgi:hypothetical protein
MSNSNHNQLRRRISTATYNVEVGAGKLERGSKLETRVSV